MEFCRGNIDDLLMDVYGLLDAKGSPNQGSRGTISEQLGILLKLQNPRARISRSENRGKTFSALGEMLWYLSGSDRLEFIEPYISRYRDDAEADGRLHGAYGPRFLSMGNEINQLQNVLGLLGKKPTTKRAVIQLFDAADLTDNFKEIPCTTTMQFFVRDNRLHLSVTMRSNDAYFGLPHDLFCFTMIQEMAACKLGYDVGEYMHYVGSLHLYDKQRDSMKDYMSEGWQRTEPMPPMPPGDPCLQIASILEAEAKLRRGEKISASAVCGEPYWADLLRLLQAYWLSKNIDSASELNSSLDILKQEIHHDIYKPFIDARRKQTQK